MHLCSGPPQRFYFRPTIRVILRLVGAVLACTLAVCVYGMVNSMHSSMWSVAVAGGLGFGLLVCGRIEKRIAHAALIVTASGIRVNWLIAQRWYPWPTLLNNSAIDLSVTAQICRPLWPVVCLEATLAELESGLNAGRKLFELRQSIATQIEHWPMDTTQSTYLRPWTHSDRSEFMRLFGDEALMQGHGLRSLSRRRIRGWFDEQMKDQHTGLSYVLRLALVYKGEDIMIGHVDVWLSHVDVGHCVIGYGVLPPWQRRGYALHAVSTIVSKLDAIDDVAGIRAHVMPDNEASIGMLSKVGFSRTMPCAGRENQSASDANGASLSFTWRGAER
ncbi:MAG: GNAT family N-acetyltransferase [Myxococcota bacterium]|nr:GNAT family N-acetyltransferase [Myxococcota bacterium]